MTTLTKQEIALLMPEYNKYLNERYKWEWKDDAVMSFDDWWRNAADEAKDRAKYKDYPTTNREIL